MKRYHSTCLMLAVVAAFVIAGCGQDNARHEHPSGSPTAVRTTIAPTSTPGSPTSTVTTETSTPTPVGSASPGVPTVTPTPTGGSVCESDHMTVVVTTRPGSDLSTGWTGIAHHQPTVEGSKVTANLDCVGNDCTVSSSLKGTPFGPPLPLASGGVPACILNTFSDEITGTYNCLTGAGESFVHLDSGVIQTSLVERPCPLCVGDTGIDDGVPGGTCDSGANKGQPCDAGGHSPTFGDTSNDCPPSATPLDILKIDIPFTTGTVTQTATTQCGSAEFDSHCFCPGDAGPETNQNRPNQCTDPGSPSGVCGSNNTCPVLPSTSTCSNEKILTCTSDSDCVACSSPFPGCTDRFPDAGTCQAGPTSCFGDTITATGVPGTQDGTLVGFFCIPDTKHAPAISSVAGLPGPGLVVLPVHAVRTPRSS